MNVKIILVFIILLVGTCQGASVDNDFKYYINVSVDGNVIGVDSDNHNHKSQNSYRIGWNDTEQQGGHEYFSPVDNVTENETLPDIPEIEPTKITSGYSWMWIIFGLLLIAMYWVLAEKKIRETVNKRKS